MLFPTESNQDNEDNNISEIHQENQFYFNKKNIINDSIQDKIDNYDTRLTEVKISDVKKVFGKIENHDLEGNIKYNYRQDSILTNQNNHNEKITFTNNSKSLFDNSKLSNDKIIGENIKNKNHNSIFSIQKIKREIQKIEREIENNTFVILIKDEDKSNVKNKIPKIPHHNKYSKDNITKKIKRLFLKYLIITINFVVKQFKTNKNKDYSLKKLKYKYSEHLNTKSDLELLKKPIKDLLSKEISKQYKSPPDTNKKIIENLLKDEEDNIIIQEVFKITFCEWIYLFRKNKAKVINGKNIKFDGIKKLYKEINQKNPNDKKYISEFKKCLNKYEEWFENKKPRKERNHLKNKKTE
jgi:hypothetical protein